MYVFRLKNLRRYLMILAVTVFALNCTARAADDQRATVDSTISAIRATLPKLNTAADSLKAMVDIYDLNPRRRAEDVIELYRLAKRAKNTSICLEMLRQLCVLAPNNDEVIKKCLAAVNDFPPSDQRDETESYMNILLVQNEPEPTTDEAVNARAQTIKMLSESYSEAIKNKENIIKRVDLIFRLSVYLKQTVTGSLMRENLDELELAVSKLNPENYVLKNHFYAFAIRCYLIIEDHKKVLELAPKYLEMLDAVENTFHQTGRKYRKLNNERLRVYSLILGCYDLLTSEQIKYFYDQAIKIADRDLENAENLRRKKLSVIFYNLSQNRYAEVFPMISEVMHDSRFAIFRPMLYNAYVKTAEYVNDREALDEALTMYNAYYESRLSGRMIGASRKLQMMYENHELKEAMAQEEARNRELEQRNRMHMIWICIIGGVIMLLIVIAVWIARRHSKRLGRSLSESNNNLKNERDALTEAHRELINARDRANVADRNKTELIHNISHEISEPTNAIVGYIQLIIDSIEKEKREQLSRYIEVIEHNAALLRSLVNDVLDSVYIGTQRMSVVINNFSLSHAVNTAVDSIQPRLKPGVSLVIKGEKDDDSFLVDNDPRRVEQVIINMLTNAARFTDKGTIEVAYHIDRTNHRATVTVTDTGVGIPAGYEELIFTRYGKVNSADAGTGLGLYVCRIICDLIGGDINLDTEYKHGARFIFTFPSDGIPKNDQPSDNNNNLKPTPQ